MKLAVYVPASSRLESILPRSAIVGSETTSRLITIDFEGNRYGAPMLDSYHARLMHAAGRHVEKYPTTARMTVQPELVKQVGWFDTNRYHLEVVDQPALTEWLGGTLLLSSPVVSGPRDVPALRQWMLSEWFPGNAFALGAGMQVVGRAGTESEKQTLVLWNLDALARAELWWVETAMCELADASSGDLPPVELQYELIPAEPVLAVLERPLIGLDADNDGRRVRVDAMMWGKAMLAHAGPAVAVTMYQRISDDEYGEFWVPLGHTHWVVGRDWSAPVLEELDATAAASMAEDRRWLATLWSLASTPRIAESRVDHGHRGDRRRASREGSPPPDVQVVSLRRVVRRPSAQADGSGREYHVRWTVRGHWRQQAYGPGRKFRRPTFIDQHVAGPDDAPLKKGSTVKVLR